MSTLRPAPALPPRSNRRASRFLEPIDPKTGLLDEQPPLSPSHPPHNVYLSSEEEASSSADDFSDYDFDSDVEVDPLTPVRRSQEDTARVVNFVYWGKPSIIELPRRLTTLQRIQADSAALQAGRVRRSTTGPLTPTRRTSTSSTYTSRSTMSRSSTAMGGTLTHKHSFLSIDPCPSRHESDQTHDPERPHTPKGSSSMLKRTLSLARKRSRPQLNQAAAQSSNDLLIRSPSEEPFSHQLSPESEAALKANRRRTVMVEPSPAPQVEPAKHVPSKLSKGHSRLRSSLSISLGRRKP